MSIYLQENITTAFVDYTNTNTNTNSNNNNNDLNTTKLEYNSKHYQSLSLVVLLTAVIAIIFIGNILVILAVLTNHKLRTITNCFVVSLALSDLLVAIIVIPPAIITNFTGYWPFGRFLCDLWVSSDIVLCSASILNLCAISIDRYFAITQPLKYFKKKRSKKLAMIMILIVWLTAFLISVPPIFGMYEEDRHSTNACRYNRNKGYVIFSAMISFFIPMTVMVFAYVRIAYVISHRHNKLQRTVIKHSKKSKNRKRRKSLATTVLYTSDGEHITIEHPECSYGNESSQFLHDKSQKWKRKTNISNSTIEITTATATATTAAATGAKATTTQQIPRVNSSIRISSLNRETKTAKTLSIVIGGFIIFWLPFFVYYILTPYLPADRINSTLMAYFTWLGWLNSAINPFIYAFHNVDFRDAFRAILTHPFDTFCDRR